MARGKKDRLPPYMFYTCPGCDKKGSVMFMLESLPYDFTCECGMGAHLRYEDNTVYLTFDHPDWVKADTHDGTKS